MPERLGWILPAYKPGSVECYHSDGHSSRRTVTHSLEQPTRSVFIEAGHLSLPIWPCSCWGLPSHDCYQSRGGLLLHHFTLACVPQNCWHHWRYAFCCTFRRCIVSIAQMLSGSMPFGARTFLESNYPLATIRPTVSMRKSN
jgi:hypothetical protein